MSGAIHGRIAATGVNRYRALENPELPRYPDVEAARQDFAAHLATLSGWLDTRGEEPLTAAERTGMWTLYLLGRREEWWATQVQRAADERAAMDAVPAVA